jgi:bacteriocin biosynthesis cyclodehydratase domain-containing protein
MRLKRYYSVVVHGPDEVELRSGAFNAVSQFLSDKDRSGHLARIVMQIDGKPLDEVARQAGASRSAVEGVIDHLIELGAVEESPGTALDDYYDRIIPGFRTVDSLVEARMPVTLLGDGALTESIAQAITELLPDAQVDCLGSDDRLVRELASLKLPDFANALTRAQIQDRYASLGGRLVVCAQLAINPYSALVLNRLMLALGSPWLWAGADGPALFIGPFTVPGKAACYQCFETRVGMNLRETSSYQRYKNALAAHAVTPAPHPLEAALRHLLIGHTAMEAVNFLTTGSAFTLGKSLCLYLPTMEFTFNDVLRVPGCAACAPTAYAQEPELYYEMRAAISGEVMR